MFVKADDKQGAVLVRIGLKLGSRFHTAATDYFLGEDKVLVMRMMLGGQLDHTDFHCAGFDLEILGVHLYIAGFEGVLNVEARKMVWA